MLPSRFCNREKDGERRKKQALTCMACRFKLKAPRTDVKTNFRERKMEDINDTIARMN